MGGGLLDIPQRHPGIQLVMNAWRSVWGPTGLVIPARRAIRRTIRPAPCRADDPPGTVPVQPAPISGQEDGSFGAFADGQVDRPGGARGERDGDDLAALAGDHQGSVAALDAERFDAGAGGLGDPQPVQREQRDQRVLRRWAKPGGDQERAEFVAVQSDCAGFRVQPRPPHVRRG